MKTSKIRIAIATAIAAVSVSAVAGPIAPSAFAQAPKTVHAGSTGNAKLDDICGQMADLINDEITEGWNAESNGDYGSANAWWGQASDHIRRAQAAGCVMAIRVPKSPTRYTGAFAGVAAGSYTAIAKRSGTRGGTTRPSTTTTTVALKKVSGTAGGGKGNLSQSQCDDIARWVNDALKKSADAAAGGDADLAAGWRQNANDLLASGRRGGCSFTAALLANQARPTAGTLSRG
jgi:hypothetical protein